MVNVDQIRCATTPEGEIEAATAFPFRQVILDRRTGNVIRANVQEGTDWFRRLVRAARVHTGERL